MWRLALAYFLHCSQRGGRGFESHLVHQNSKNGLRPLTCGAQRSCHPPFCPTFFRPLLNSFFDHQASAIMVDHTGAVEPASLTQQDRRSVGRSANAKTSTSSRQLDQEKVESFEIFTRHSQRTCRRAVTYFVCGSSTYQSTSTTPGVCW